MDSLYYTLKGHEVVPCDGPDELTKLATSEWSVGRNSVGDWEVRTFFLGVDMNYGRSRRAVFETVGFDGDRLRAVHARYATWEQAEVGHARAIRRVRRWLGYDQLRNAR